MAIDLTSLTIERAREHLASGDFSAEDLASAYLEEIKKQNGDINAYLEVYPDVMDQARHADKMIKEGKGGPLTGIPISIKDNILIEGKEVSAASKILNGYRATYDATAISKLKDAGAVLLGRTNMDEFAMGGSTEHSAFGVTKNPSDPSRVAGGSSGGAAASVAMNGALGALGSDTGGSVRQPGSYCGVVGLKPTYGSVSRHGLIAMGSSLDVIGTFGKTVADAQIIFEAIRGMDPKDSTSIEGTPKKSGKKTIGIPRKFFENGGVDPDMMKCFERSVDALRQRGYEIVDIDLPNIAYALSVYYVIMPAESSTNLARFDGIKYGLSKGDANLQEVYAKSRGEGFGKEVRRRILLGTYVLSAGYYDAYYNKAVTVRSLIAEDFKRAFEKVGIIMTPTAPGPAFPIGTKTNDPLAMYLEDIFTVPANIAGIPAISVPGGWSEVDGKKLPLGIQFMAPHLEEETLFEVGKALEASQS